MMGTGIPLRGDRSARDVLNYEVEHSNEFEPASERRHTPLPGAAGGVIYSDGSRWVRGDALPLAYLEPGERGDIIRRDDEDWDNYSAKGEGFLLQGDGTDVISAPFVWSVLANALGANVAHDHLSATGGGNLSTAALTSGLLPLVRGGTGSDLSVTACGHGILQVAATGAGAVVTLVSAATAPRFLCRKQDAYVFSEIEDTDLPEIPLTRLEPGTIEGQYIRAGLAAEWSALALPNAAATGDLLMATEANVIGTLANGPVAGRPLLAGGGENPRYCAGPLNLPVHTSTPTGTKEGDLWLERTPATTVGSPIGLLLTLTQAESGQTLLLRAQDAGAIRSVRLE